MSCSACIENPTQFLATSARHLMLQKQLPPVYDDELLGNTPVHIPLREYAISIIF